MECSSGILVAEIGLVDADVLAVHLKPVLGMDLEVPNFAGTRQKRQLAIAPGLGLGVEAKAVDDRRCGIVLAASELLGSQGQRHGFLIGRVTHSTNVITASPPSGTRR